ILLLPCFVFGQSTDEKYALYSDCLRTINKDYLERDKGNHVFVVKVTPGYSNSDLISKLSDLVGDTRNYIKNPSDNKWASELRLFYGQIFLDTIRKDTSWLPLLTRLSV